MGIFCIINETILILLSYSFVATTQQPTTPFGKRKQLITKDDVACKRKNILSTQSILESFWVCCKIFQSLVQLVTNTREEHQTLSLSNMSLA